MRAVLPVLIATMFGAGPALAADPTQPEAIARAAAMKEIGRNSKLLGDMAGGKSAYDAAAADAAKAALMAAPGSIVTAFATEGSPDPASEAAPAIWTSWDDFLVKTAALEQAASGLDTGSAEAIKTGMGAIGASCKGCHSVYRE